MRLAPILFGILTASFVLIGVFRHYAFKRGGFIDVPNTRSSHDTPTPRGGGIVFIGLWALLATSYIRLESWGWSEYVILVPQTLLIALIGFLDDRKPLSAKTRFAVHLIAALLSVTLMGGFPSLIVGERALPLGFFGSAFAVIAIVWSLNLYNFMDGTDGFAATEAMFLFGAGGFFVWFAGGINLAIVLWTLVATTTSFLFWNWPKAKIFMGDVGSGSLGFMAGVAAFLGETRYKVPMLVWLIVYSPFFFDATVTLLRRMAHGEKWYLPHKRHAFQRLIQAGWSHRKLLYHFIPLNAALIAIAFLAYFRRSWLIPMVLVTFSSLALVYARIERINPMYPKKQG